MSASTAAAVAAKREKPAEADRDAPPPSKKAKPAEEADEKEKDKNEEKKKRNAGLVVQLLVKDPDRFVEWAGRALGASVNGSVWREGGKFVFAGLDVNGVEVYVTAPSLDWAGGGKYAADPKGPPGRGVLLHLEVEDPAAAASRAVEAGATLESAVKKQSWGALYGQVRDPWGHIWAFSSVQ